MSNEDYYVVPIIPTEESELHTAEHPFCFNSTCPCHEDQTLIAPVHDAYQKGEFTAEEATEYTQGKLIYGGW